MNGEGGFRGAPRSYLYVPGDAVDKLEKALTRGADAVIIDLEDAVAPRTEGAGACCRCRLAFLAR